jgi:hypothetical protein
VAAGEEVPLGHPLGTLHTGVLLFEIRQGAENLEPRHWFGL